MQPETTLAGELLAGIEELPVVDCHEHLPEEAERVGEQVDVITLFTHYCKADLEAAGLPQGETQKELADTGKPLLERWRRFKPFYEAIRFGSYAYPAIVYVRDVLGFDHIGDDTVEAISARLQEDNRPGLYRRLLRERCGIEKAILCREKLEGDQDFFVYLCQSQAVGCDPGALEKKTDRALHTLGDMVDAIGACAQEQKRRGAVGLKVGMAYSRTLEVDNPSAADAERVFLKLRRYPDSQVSDQERRLLQDYLLRREVEACIEQGLVVVIHTGYQAGNRNDIRNARAVLLWSLLREYPRARFDLFHGSFPYVSDMTVLGKYFANVSLNMCWMHIMGPAVSRRALAEWFDAVPVTKIFAFGGDYCVVEKVYGHLRLARYNVAHALADRVRVGRMSKAEALEVARLLFHDNPRSWYGI